MKIRNAQEYRDALAQFRALSTQIAEMTQEAFNQVMALAEAIDAFELSRMDRLRGGKL